MRIKRYFAKNIREAIKRVREEQGPDAVILSNRHVEGGIELVAAIDFEEVLLCDEGVMVNSKDSAPATPVAPNPTPVTAATQPPQSEVPTPAAPEPSHAMPTAESAPTQASHDPYKEIHRAARASAFTAMQREMRDLRGMLEQQIAGVAWGNMAKFQPKQAKLLQRLMRIELNPALCEKIVDEMALYPQADYSWRQALGLLARKIPVTNDDILDQGGVVALVGPTGVGKTTTVAKLAARFTVRHGARSVALITTDNFRIGAHEQLRAYAKILNIPLRVVSSRADLRQGLNDFSDRKLVLIDTAGMSQRDLRLSEQFSLIKGGSSLIKTYLVLSATTRVEGLSEITHTFGRIKLSGCIVTKVDEIDVLGNILNILIKYQLPIAYISDGQRVPDMVTMTMGEDDMGTSGDGLVRITVE